MILTIIELPCYKISVEMNKSEDGTVGAGISSELHDSEKDSFYNASIDGLESMILSCACAGIDIDTPAFILAIENTVESISNNHE